MRCRQTGAAGAAGRTQGRSMSALPTGQMQLQHAKLPQRPQHSNTSGWQVLWQGARGPLLTSDVVARQTHLQLQPPPATCEYESTEPAAAAHSPHFHHSSYQLHGAAIYALHCCQVASQARCTRLAAHALHLQAEAAGKFSATSPISISRAEDDKQGSLLIRLVLQWSKCFI